MDILSISEGSICKSLHSYFANNCKYRLSNAYIFNHDWESDFFVQKQNRYSYEFEVKISRADFFNDKKKTKKHCILNTGIYHKKIWNVVTENGIRTQIEGTKAIQHNFRPNKFFYVVPEGMITIDELPSYAGLFYYGTGPNYNYNLRKVKDAPFIHKEQLRYEEVLCNKFYHYWLNSIMEIRSLTNQIRSLKLENHII